MAAPMEAVSRMFGSRVTGNHPPILRRLPGRGDRLAIYNDAINAQRPGAKEMKFARPRATDIESVGIAARVLLLISGFGVQV